MHSRLRNDLPDDTLARALRTVERGRRAYRHYLGIIKAQRSAMAEGRWAQLPVLQAHVTRVEPIVAEMVRTVKPIRARIESEHLSGPNVARLETATAGAIRDAALVSYHLDLLTTDASAVRDRTGIELGRTHTGPTRPAPRQRVYGPSTGPERVLDRAG